MNVTVRLALLIALALAACLTGVSLAPLASAGSATVAVTSASIPLGGTGSVTLQVRNAPSIGISAWTINVSYDPSVAAIDSCDAGASGICNAAIGPSTFRVNGASAGGLRGNPVVLATITFRCGQQGASETVTPQIGVLSDATLGAPQPIGASTQSGTITCVVPPPPTRPPPATPTPPRPPTATFTPPPAQPGGHQTNTPTRVPTSGPAGGGATGTGAAPTGTRAAGATPTSTLRSSVLGSTKPPTPPAAAPKTSSTHQASVPAASVRPETSSAVLGADQLSTNARVIGTNIVLAIILLIVFFFMSTLFNGTLDENRDEIERFISRFTTPLERVTSAAQGGWKSFAGGVSWMEWAVAPSLILGITGLIYSFNDPTWGINAKSLVLFLSVVIAVSLTTLIYEGGEALVHRRRHNVSAGIRLFPTAIAIAVAFVALSRLVGFHAPVMFGFIAASAVLVPVALDHRQTGFAIFVPATILLLLSLGAWGLVVPLRHLSNSSNQWYAVLPGETAAMLFACGIEGLLFCMIPLEFLDGQKIVRWNALAWLPLFGIPAFIFAWVILNPAAKSFDILLERRVIAALTVAAVYSAATVVLWAFFHLQRRSREAVGA